MRTCTTWLHHLFPMNGDDGHGLHVYIGFILVRTVKPGRLTACCLFVLGWQGKARPGLHFSCRDRADYCRTHGPKF